MIDGFCLLSFTEVYSTYLDFLPTLLSCQFLEYYIWLDLSICDKNTNL